MVPDGKLHLVPFAGLQNRQGRYAVEAHVITYAPSGTVLQLLRSLPPERKSQLPLLAVGNATYEEASAAQLTSADREDGLTRVLYDARGASFPQLPSTEKEVTTAAQIAGKKSVLLLGRNATEAAFKAQPLSNFKLLHLALHGIVDPTFPDRAALVFAQDPKSA